MPASAFDVPATLWKPTSTGARSLARVSASRFAFLLGEGARLERALVQFMLDVHTREHGYLEVLAPVLVNSASMVGTANLPKFGADAFKVEDRDLWLVPTAEVPLTNLHAGETLAAGDLPLAYTSWTPCFRSEAGAAGSPQRRPATLRTRTSTSPRP